MLFLSFFLLYPHKSTMLVVRPQPSSIAVGDFSALGVESGNEMATSLASIIEPLDQSNALSSIVDHSDRLEFQQTELNGDNQQRIATEDLALHLNAALALPSTAPTLEPSVPTSERQALETQDFSGEFSEQGEMYHGIRVLNMSRAKSVLKRELFDWIENSTLLKRAGMQHVQVVFTKCGRFAIIVAMSSRLRSFGLRLATLDPHHRLSTYLLGVSLTLESALLHSAARVKQIEDDLDEMDKTFQHGDVVHVEHLGYSHVAVYNAHEQVFYELIGDVESGADAFLAQASNAQSAALKFQQELKTCTEQQLKAALSVFRSVPIKSGPETTTTSVTEYIATSETPANSVTPTITFSSDAETIPSPSTTPSISTSFSTTIESPLPSRLNSASNSSATTPDTTPVPGFISSLSAVASSSTSTSTEHAHAEHTASAGATVDSSPSPTPASSPSYAHLTPHAGQSYAPPPVFEFPHLPPGRKAIESILAHSGHMLSPSLDNNTAFSDSHDGLSDDEHDFHATEGDTSLPFDVKTSLAEATRKLRNLATSSDDFGLKLLLQDDESTYFTSAEHDESIQPDEMCPAMAYGFPSHSIAEVQATPKDIFLMRDPLLKKRVKFYANALPPDVVVARAKSALGSPGWNPITRNCEHFATWAKTGRTVSTQVYEIGSNTAIVGTSTLQTIVTLAFFGLTILWIVGKFVNTNYAMEMFELGFSWFLKFGVLISSLVVALGMLVHWQNGTSANFDEYVLQTNSVTTITTSTNVTSPSAPNAADTTASSHDTQLADSSTSILHTISTIKTSDTIIGSTSAGDKLKTD